MDSGKGKKKGQKKRRTKDPLRPKRALSSYFYFASHFRQQLKSDGKEIKKVGQLTKDIGEAWQALGEKDRKPFEAQAKVDKDRFLREMEDYKKTKGIKKKKRARTAYFQFLGEFRKRPEIAELPVQEVSKQAGEQWRGLSEEEKKPYVLLFEAERKKLAEEEAAGEAAAAAEKEMDGEDDDEEEEEEDDDDDDE